MKRFFYVMLIILAFCGWAIAQEIDDDWTADLTGEGEEMGAVDEALEEVDWDALAMEEMAATTISGIPTSRDEVNQLFEEAARLFDEGNVEEAITLQEQAKAGLNQLLQSESERAIAMREWEKEQKRLDRQLNRISDEEKLAKEGKWRASFIGKALFNMKETLNENASSWGDLGVSILMFLLIILIGALLGWLIGNVIIKNILHVSGFDNLAAFRAFGHDGNPPYCTFI